MLVLCLLLYISLHYNPHQEDQVYRIAKMVC